jgi:hypothetical protein
MNAEQLAERAQHPELFDAHTLYDFRTFAARYPYCASLRLLLLRNLYVLRDDTFTAELRKSAPYIHDRRVLFRLIEGETHPLDALSEADIDAELAEVGELDRTLTLIDRFLQTHADDLPSSAPTEIAVSDYVRTLLDEPSLPSASDEQTTVHTAGLINRYLEQPHDAPRENEATDEFVILDEAEASDGDELNIEMPDEDVFFTETLAKICIKQRRYERALEIIKKLRLKYPTKNAYFADQIRFLEKLIINANSK